MVIPAGLWETRPIPSDQLHPRYACQPQLGTLRSHSSLLTQILLARTAMLIMLITEPASPPPPPRLTSATKTAVPLHRAERHRGKKKNFGKLWQTEAQSSVTWYTQQWLTETLYSGTLTRETLIHWTIYAVQWYMGAVCSDTVTRCLVINWAQI